MGTLFKAEWNNNTCDLTEITVYDDVVAIYRYENTREGRRKVEGITIPRELANDFMKCLSGLIELSDEYNSDKTLD